MASQTWVNLLNAGTPWQTTAGTALSASASTATISPQAAGPQDFVLPGQPNGLQWYPGMTLKVEAAGTLNTGGTTSNLTVFLACGASGTLGTTLTTTGALTLGTGSLTGIEWNIKAWIRCTAIGSSGNTLAAAGAWTVATTAGSNTGTLSSPAVNSLTLMMPETATAFNSYTAATALGLRATLSAAFGAIQCNEFLIYQAG
jgi:hypothetical protein